jgi:phosphatidylserine/phosphatidylglycerophosphate/cardiolipin synthase-like enzyme
MDREEEGQGEVADAADCIVKLIIQPDDGLAPLLNAVRKAKKSVDIVIFRFDRPELERALESAVSRGIVVRALIAHTNRGGEKSLRKLELRLLAAGVTVARTADDLPRYHGKMMLIDEATLYVFGFNYTKLDVEHSRSFGVATTDKKLVKEGAALFEADRTRQSYMPGDDRLVVSPESSREVLTTFIKRARKQLLIYDEKISDRLVLRVLQQRVKAGVEIRVIGKCGKAIDGLIARKMPDLRLHVRAMVRDGASAFIGSQSLRRLELDGRREVGILINDLHIVKQLQGVFEDDWKEAGGKPLSVPEAKLEKAKEKEKEKDKEEAESKAS